jgi:hypothetical protein
VASIKNTAMLSSLWVDDRAYNDAYGNNTYAPNTTGYSPNQPHAVPLVFAKPKTSMNYPLTQGDGYGRTQLKLTDTQTGFVGQNVDTDTYQVLGSGTSDPNSPTYGRRRSATGGYKAGNESYGHFGNQTVKIKKDGWYFFTVNLPMQSNITRAGEDFSRVKVQLWVNNTAIPGDFYGTDFTSGVDVTGTPTTDGRVNGRGFANAQYTVLKKFSANDTFQIRVQGTAETYNGSDGNKLGNTDGTLPWDTNTKTDDWNRVSFCQGYSLNWGTQKAEEAATVMVERIDDSDRVLYLGSTRTEGSSNNFRPDSVKEIAWNQQGSDEARVDASTYEVATNSQDIKVKRTGWYFLSLHARYSFALTASSSSPLSSYLRILKSDTAGDNYTVPTTELPSYIRPASGTVYRPLSAAVQGGNQYIDRHGTLNYGTFIELTAGMHLKVEIARDSDGTNVTQVTTDSRAEIYLRYHGTAPKGLALYKSGAPEEIGNGTSGNESLNVWNYKGRLYSALWGEQPTLTGWTSVYADTGYWGLSGANITQKKAGTALHGFNVGLEQDTHAPSTAVDQSSYDPKSAAMEVTISPKRWQTTTDGVHAYNVTAYTLTSVSGLRVGDWIAVAGTQGLGASEITHINATTKVVTTAWSMGGTGTYLVDDIPDNAVVIRPQGSNLYRTSQQGQNFYTNATKRALFLGSIAPLPQLGAGTEMELSVQGTSWAVQLTQWTWAARGTATDFKPKFTKHATNEPPIAWFRHLLNEDQGSGEGTAQNAVASGEGDVYAVHESTSGSGIAQSATTSTNAAYLRHGAGSPEAASAIVSSAGIAWTTHTSTSGAGAAQSATTLTNAAYLRHGAGAVSAASVATPSSEGEYVHNVTTDISTGVATTSSEGEYGHNVTTDIIAIPATTSSEGEYVHNITTATQAQGAIGWGVDDLNDRIHHTVVAPATSAGVASVDNDVDYIRTSSEAVQAQGATTTTNAAYLKHDGDGTEITAVPATAAGEGEYGHNITTDTQGQAATTTIAAEAVSQGSGSGVAQASSAESVSDFNDRIVQNTATAIQAQSAEIEADIERDIFGDGDADAQSATVATVTSYIYQTTPITEATNATTSAAGDAIRVGDAAVISPTATATTDSTYIFTSSPSIQAQSAIGWGVDDLNDRIHHTVVAPQVSASVATTSIDADHVRVSTAVGISAVSPTVAIVASHIRNATAEGLAQDATATITADAVSHGSGSGVAQAASAESVSDFNDRIVQDTSTAIQAQSAIVVSEDPLQDLIHEDESTAILAGQADATVGAAHIRHGSGSDLESQSAVVSSAATRGVESSSSNVTAQSAIVVSEDPLQDLIHYDESAVIIASAASVTSSGHYLINPDTEGDGVLQAQTATAIGVGDRTVLASSTAQAQSATTATNVGLISSPSLGYNLNLPLNTYVIFTTLD